eukprot:100420-Chlamydomonas_euryale.AAC.1
MTHSALAAKMASWGCASSVAAASLGNAALANEPKQGGGGYSWRWDPALSTFILCQAGQRGPSAPMESPPQSWRPCRSGSSKSCQVGDVWRGVEGRHCRPGSSQRMSGR